MNRAILLVSFFIVFVTVDIFAQQSKITTVILIRHAEKTATPENDPVLSDKGKKRAELIAQMFSESEMNAVYATQYARTRLTAEPLAKKLGVPVQVIDANGTGKLVQEIRAKHHGGTVVVIGHSNTLPEIANALGVANMAEIDDADYDNLYVLSLPEKGAGKVLRMKFFADSDAVCQ